MSVVSVILPSYNSQAWVAEAIESVLTQTHEDLELIVIDDGSTDNTLNIINSLAKDSRLKLVKRPHRSGGPATPRNEGIELASGDYLAFIDSDDVWHPEKLELQLKTMQRQQLNFLSSLHVGFREAAPTPQTIDQTGISTQRKNHRKLLNKNWVVTSSAVMSAHLLEGLKFDQSPEYIGIEDYLLWLYIHQRNDIQSAVLEAPLVFYRLRDDSISASKRIMALKIYYLLSHYQVKRKPLGLKKYYFFMTYALASITARLTQR